MYIYIFFLTLQNRQNINLKGTKGKSDILYAVCITHNMAFVIKIRFMIIFMPFHFKTQYIHVIFLQNDTN